MRKGIIAIVIAVVLLGGYVVGQTATKNATTDVFEQLAERIAEQSGYNIDLIWLEQRWGSGQLEMHISVEGIDELRYREVIDLNYGFLRTKINGSGQLVVFGSNVNDTIFDGQAFTSTGVAGMGGLTMEYSIPTIEKELDEGLILNIPESILQVVATDSTLHFTFNNPGFLLTHDVDPGHFEVGATAIESHTAWRLGKLHHQQVDMTFSGVTAETPDLNFAVTDMRFASHLIVEDGFASGGMRYELGHFNIPDVGTGTGLIEFELEGANYALFEALQRDPELLEDEDYMAGLLYELLHNNDAKLTLNTFEFEAEGLGRAHLHGELTVADIDLSQDEFQLDLLNDPEFLMQYIELSLHVEELPLIALMAMMMITTEQLPWLFEMRDGHFYLNGEQLDLEEMGMQ
ncbi:YdgA family protein [Aliidiomarina indica]|uniref:DUF945 family protein n=1 Tax=Aliidiomarina indica TaxID=2749147 RepID=UPI00188E3B03|nr:DUF945 family protein [Aliidiomarina indica]